jgi:peroxiredoxin family protein
MEEKTEERKKATIIVISGDFDKLFAACFLPSGAYELLRKT